jgi:curli biogenesis system outer membrane secretion channel CsgG
MKKICILVFIIGILILISSCVTTKTTKVVEYNTRLDNQLTVAVIEVKNKTKYGERRLSDSAADILVTEMSRSRSFILVEREKIDQILEELEFQMSDLSDDTTAAQLGKMLNCQYMISGAITNFGVKTEGKDLIIAQQKIQKVNVEVDLKIIEVETAQIVYSAYGQGTAEKAVDNVLGMGGSASYDESLAGDGLRAAISQAVIDMVDFFKSEED